MATLLGRRTGGGAAALASVGVLAVVIGAWEVATSRGWIDPFFLGRPSDIASVVEGWIAEGTLWKDASATLSSVLGGLALAYAVGFPLGLALGLSKFWREVFDPFIAFVLGTPRLVFYPLFAVWLGFGLQSKVFHVASVLSLLVVVSTSAGVREVDSTLVGHVRTAGASWSQLVAHVYVPSMLTRLVGGARLVFGVAFQAAVVAEFIGPSEGLGHLAVVGIGLFDVNVVWAAIVSMLAVAIPMDAALRWVERRATRWRALSSVAAPPA